jgi:hypothetical protein
VDEWQRVESSKIGEKFEKIKAAMSNTDSVKSAPKVKEVKKKG